MKNAQSLIFIAFISIISSFLTACSNETEESPATKVSTGDHVWKSQTDALKSAKDITKKMQQSLKQHQEDINESN